MNYARNSRIGAFKRGTVGRYALKVGRWIRTLGNDSPRYAALVFVECPLRELCQ